MSVNCPCSCSSMSNSVEASASSLKQNDGTIPGVSGIANHGNSCFANAVVQCLSNTKLFGDFFTSDRYLHDLKAAVEDGRSCSVTETLAQLIESLWNCSYKREISRRFITVINEHADIFANGKQSDAHEFFLWLLNRIKDELHVETDKSSKKMVQYQQSDSANNNDDAEHGTEVNNVCDVQSDSEIVSSLFQGQFYSTLTCPVCQKESANVEPFLFLPLYIPDVNHLLVSVTVITSGMSNKQRAHKVSVRVNDGDTILDFRNSLAIVTNIALDELVVVLIDEQNGFGKVLDDETGFDTVLSHIDSLFGIQLAFGDASVSDGSLFVVAVNTVEIKNKPERFGNPIVVQVITELNVNDMDYCFLCAMKRWLKKGLFERGFRNNGRLFRMKVIDDQLQSWTIPEVGVKMPLRDAFVQRTLASMAKKGPPYLRMVLQWDEATYYRLFGQSRLEAACGKKEDQLAHSIFPCTTLYNCLDALTENETLESKDSWFCSECCRHQTGTVKTLCISTVPDILVIQLKRFKQWDSYNSKVESLVDFPIKSLDLNDYVKQCDQNSPSEKKCCLYDLYAVCNHCGNTESGHYIANYDSIAFKLCAIPPNGMFVCIVQRISAYSDPQGDCFMPTVVVEPTLCKNPKDARWYRFDDHYVQECHESELVTDAAYLLFYQRCCCESNSVFSSLTDEPGALLSCTSDSNNSLEQGGGTACVASAATSESPDLQIHSKAQIDAEFLTVQRLAQMTFDCDRKEFSPRGTNPRSRSVNSSVGSRSTPQNTKTAVSSTRDSRSYRPPKVELKRKVASRKSLIDQPSSQKYRTEPVLGEDYGKKNASFRNLDSGSYSGSWREVPIVQRPSEIPISSSTRLQSEKSPFLSSRRFK